MNGRAIGDAVSGVCVVVFVAAVAFFLLRCAQ